MDSVQKNVNPNNNNVNKHEKEQHRKNIAKILGKLSGENKWRKKRAISAIIRNRERGQFIVSTLSEYFDLNNIKIIEMGCGVGWQTVELARYCPNVVGIDTSENTLNLAKSYSKIENVTVTHKKCDACTTGYQDKYFDVAIASHLLEHSQSHEGPIKEAKRILKPDGIFFIASPNWLWPIEPHFELPFLHWVPKKIANKYVHRFKRATDYSEVTKIPNYFEITQLLKKHGFSTEDISYKKLKKGTFRSMLERIKILRRFISVFSPGWILICKKL